MHFKQQIWRLQTFKYYVLKSLFLSEIGVFCLPVGIEEHLRAKYLHLKIKIQRDWRNGETELVSQGIIRRGYWNSGKWSNTSKMDQW